MLDRLRLSSLLLLLTACDPPSDDDGPQWSVPLVDLDGALFSIWGTGSDDVWTVGSDPGDGPYLLHWDGDRWERMSTGTSGDLWWVHAGRERVWMCGDGGLVLRYDRAQATIESVETPTEHLLFGVYEIAAGEVWAVGGDPIQKAGVVLRLQGDAFVELDVPEEAADNTFFKVWGASVDDVWIVGHGGKALHYDGQSLSARDVPQRRPLLTVHGRGSDVVAVGGFGTGLITQIEGGELVERTPMGAPQMNGVFVTADSTFAAGTQGSIMQRTDGEWALREDTPRLPQDYHAVYVDPEGGVWAVGGDIVAPPYRRGVLSVFGHDDVKEGW